MFAEAEQRADREKKLRIIEREAKDYLDIVEPDYFMGQNEEEIKARINRFREGFDNRIAGLKTQALPQSQTGSVNAYTGMNKESFQKMTLDERAQLLNTNPDLYNKLK
jgi:hypothetical protein